MDSIKFQHIKMEKPRGIFNLQAVKSFTNLFRVMELILLLILISKLSFPSMNKLSGDIFRKAAVCLVSPRFVFFVGNVIVVTLFAKSRRYSSAHETTEAVSNDLYQELVYKTEKKTSHEVHETKTEQRVGFERCKAFESNTHGGKIMRSYDSEKHLKVYDSDKKVVVVRAKKSEDKMSNEQFRTKIEAFIARQKRIQKDQEHFDILDPLC